MGNRRAGPRWLSRRLIYDDLRAPVLCRRPSRWCWLRSVVIALASRFRRFRIGRLRRCAADLLYRHAPAKLPVGRELLVWIGWLSVYRVDLRCPSRRSTPAIPCWRHLRHSTSRARPARTCCSWSGDRDRLHSVHQRTTRPHLISGARTARLRRRRAGQPHGNRRRGGGGGAASAGWYDPPCAAVRARPRRAGRTTVWRGR